MRVMLSMTTLITVSDGNGHRHCCHYNYGDWYNDTPVAVNDTDSVVEDGSVTKTGSEDDVLYDDTMLMTLML